MKFYSFKKLVLGIERDLIISFNLFFFSKLFFFVGLPVRQSIIYYFQYDFTGYYAKSNLLQKYD